MNIIGGICASATNSLSKIQAAVTHISTSSRFQKFKKVLSAGLRAKAAYALFDEGLGRALGLETLRHGDRLSRYVPDFIFGADPSTRVRGVGSCEGRFVLEVGVARDCWVSSRGYYYLFRDGYIHSALDRWMPGGLGSLILKLGLPKYHAILSGIGGTFSESSKGISRYARLVLGIIDGLITPTLKFRFTANDLIRNCVAGRIENDSDYASFPIAFRTAEKIGPWHLGISGSLFQLLKDPVGAFEGIMEAPGSAIGGLALMAGGLLLAKKTYDSFVEERSPVKSSMLRIAGSIFLFALTAL